MVTCGVSPGGTVFTPQDTESHREKNSKSQARNRAWDFEFLMPAAGMTIKITPVKENL
jgi:hypothetical protein